MHPKWNTSWIDCTYACEFTSRLLEKSVLHSINVSCINVFKCATSAICHYHMTYTCQFSRFTLISKCSPLALWDTKLFIGCAPQNLGWNSRSFRYFSTVFRILFIRTYYSSHILFLTFYIVGKCAISDTPYFFCSKTLIDFFMNLHYIVNLQITLTLVSWKHLFWPWTTIRVNFNGWNLDDFLYTLKLNK